MLKLIECTIYVALAGTIAATAFLPVPPCAILTMAGLTLAQAICIACKT